jgi:Mg2+ and Co2+ transporter CorA
MLADGRAEARWIESGAQRFLFCWPPPFFQGMRRLRDRNGPFMLTAIPADSTSPVWIDLLMPDEADISRIEQDYGIKVPDRAALREIDPPAACAPMATRST